MTFLSRVLIKYDWGKSRNRLKKITRHYFSITQRCLTSDCELLSHNHHTLHLDDQRSESTSTFLLAIICIQMSHYGSHVCSMVYRYEPYQVNSVYLISQCSAQGSHYHQTRRVSRKSDSDLCPIHKIYFFTRHQKNAYEILYATRTSTKSK